MSGLSNVRVVANLPALFQAEADDFVSGATNAVKSNGRFTAALSGGSTPKALYGLLATNYRDTLPWDKMFFFFGDERHVPPDHPDSNYRMASEAMLSKVPVPAANVFRVSAENPDAHQAAAEYEQTLRTFFKLSAGIFPRFDLVLLGMGPDGHTASLFPGSKGLQERSRLVIANWVEKFQTDRITLTLPVLNNAAAVTFLAGGADKADTLKEVLQGKQPPELFPSKLVHPTNGQLTWLVDQAAASKLSNTHG
jgi:6-phosphogluconolactonase